MKKICKRPNFTNDENDIADDEWENNDNNDADDIEGNDEGGQMNGMKRGNGS